MRFSIDFLYKVNRIFLYIRENFVKRHKFSFTTGVKLWYNKNVGAKRTACPCFVFETWNLVFCLPLLIGGGVT